MERIPKEIYTQEFREQAIRLVEVDGLPIILTIIATGATPDDEREFGEEGGGKRSRKFLAV